jgi:hypothetical protein
MFVISTACKQFIQRRWPAGWQNRQAARKAPTRCPRQATPCGPWFASLTRSPRVGGAICSFGRRSAAGPSGFRKPLLLPGGSQTDGSGFVRG